VLAMAQGKNCAIIQTTDLLIIIFGGKILLGWDVPAVDMIIYIEQNMIAQIVTEQDCLNTSCPGCDNALGGGK
jgi:hypothetical protein